MNITINLDCDQLVQCASLLLSSENDNSWHNHLSIATSCRSTGDNVSSFSKCITAGTAMLDLNSSVRSWQEGSSSGKQAAVALLVKILKSILRSNVYCKERSPPRPDSSLGEALDIATLSTCPKVANFKCRWPEGGLSHEWSRPLVSNELGHNPAPPAKVLGADAGADAGNQTRSDNEGGMTLPLPLDHLW